MIVPSLYADLCARGVRLSVAETPNGGELPPLRLHVQAPKGALNESLHRALVRHRDELLALVFELEETEAVLTEHAGYDPETERREALRQAARECVRGGTATPDGELWLRSYAMNHPSVQTMLKSYYNYFGEHLDVFEIRRERQAALIQANPGHPGNPGYMLNPKTGVTHQ